MLTRYLAPSFVASSFLYHGSPHRQGAIAFGLPGNQAPAITAGQPFYVTSSLKYARHFARGGVVSALQFTQGAIIDFHHLELLNHLLDIYDQDPKIVQSDGPWNEEFEGSIDGSPYRLLESPAVMQYLQDQGFSAVFLPEDIELNVTALAILDTRSVEFSHLMPERALMRHDQAFDGP
ncbi:hypothetical protein [Pseudomonas sp. S1(2024)]|uniref:hypothetical protein n=1 Tax=Pseudomonas sp. S1(2024) TaxID=3390191 RepID=UPI0039787ED4